MKTTTRHLLTKFGNPKNNQTVVRVTFDDGTWYEDFTSYSTTIGRKFSDGHVQLIPGWKSSSTTTQYRNQWLDENTAATRKKIKDGEYTVVDYRHTGWNGVEGEFTTRR